MVGLGGESRKLNDKLCKGSLCSSIGLIRIPIVGALGDKRDACCLLGVLPIVADPNSVFPNMPCMKRVYRKNRRLPSFRKPGTKRASRPADKTLINRSIVDFVLPSVFIGFRLCVLLEKLLEKR